MLITGVSKLRALHRRKGSAIREHVNSMLELNPEMQQDFSYRNPEDDQLFQADYDHMGSDEDCKNCDEERLMFQLSTILWPYWLRTSNDTGVPRERLRQEREAAELPMHRNTRDLRLL